MADKIDQLTIPNSSGTEVDYDIDLPPDATPSIASLTTSGNINCGGNFNLPAVQGLSATTTAKLYITNDYGSQVQVYQEPLIKIECSGTNLSYNYIRFPYSYTAGSHYYTLATTSDITVTGVTDDILDGSVTSKSLKYAPYSSKGAGHFYTGTTNPSSTNRLNYDGYFYATALYKGATEVKPITITTTSGSQSVSDGTNTLSFGANAFNSTTIPTTYLSSASVSGNTLTLTPSSGTAVTFTPSGTPQQYEHNIRVYNTGQINARFNILTTSSTALTYSSGSLSKALNDAGYTSSTTALPASGLAYYSPTSGYVYTFMITGVYSTNKTTNLSFVGIILVTTTTSNSTATITATPGSDVTTSFTLSSSFTINDMVRTL